MSEACTTWLMVMFGLAAWNLSIAWVMNHWLLGTDWSSMPEKRLSQKVISTLS